MLDSGVCLRWFLAIDTSDTDADAFDLLEQIRAQRIQLVEPTVWATEIAAVLAHALPPEAPGAVEEILSLRVEYDSAPATLRRAIALSMRYRRHLFDTIYHATALQQGIPLITVDESYYQRALPLGNILLLRDWRSLFGIAEERASYITTQYRNYGRRFVHRRTISLRRSGFCSPPKAAVRQ